MGNDIILAMAPTASSTVSQFALNHYQRAGAELPLRMLPGQTHPFDETIHAANTAVPQVRQTFTVLGQHASGKWGYSHGINQHHVAMAFTTWRSRIHSCEHGLTGPELVRLTLERCHSAVNALDVLTGLIDRYGQTGEAGEDHDNIFVIADGAEVYVLETAGKYWALLECRQPRVVTNAPMIRQDWSRLSPGLAQTAIRQGWYQDDGSKLNFASSLEDTMTDRALAYRRWGHASLSLANAPTPIDVDGLRDLLARQYEYDWAKHAVAGGHNWNTTFIASLTQGPQLPMAWVSFGLPAAPLYFPVFLVGDLPASYCSTHPEIPTVYRQMPALAKLPVEVVRRAVERLQITFDRDAAEFLNKADTLRLQGSHDVLASQATTLMQQHVDLFEREWRHLHHVEETKRPEAPRAEEVYYFA